MPIDRLRRVLAGWVLCLVAGSLISDSACARQAAGTAPTPPPVHFPAGWSLPAGRSPVAARHGMVVTTDSLASAAGLEILRAGGTAIDAAIAVQFALAVTDPQAGNIGGGGFMVIRFATGDVAALDFRERAPGRATADMYIDSAGEVTGARWTGVLAAGVPGSVAGMDAAHRRFGTLPWRRLIDPAIHLARDGFAVRADFRSAIAAEADRLARFPSSAPIFLPGGMPPATGSRFRQPDLARTLQAIAEAGPQAFYRGWIGDSLAAQMRRDGGLISRADLVDYEAKWRSPIITAYRGYQVISMPPPSSGGVTLAEMLHILEPFDLAGMGWHSADAIHVAAEAMRRAYADRNAYLGDPDQIEMPLHRLLSSAHADSLRLSIDMQHASRSSRADASPAEHGQTTHFSVIDSVGNAVALTTTLNGGFGAAVVVRGAGFLLNNEMDDFTTRPGTPNAYGLVQGEANAIAPGRRMLSSMTPTIVVDGKGRTVLITGTPGGATIITTVLQIILNDIDFGLPVQTSVNAPRFHHQNLPDTLYVERGGLEPDVLAELRRRGHHVAEREGTWGDVESIRMSADGTRLGAADPRGGGRALGY